jgi:hypothetical protein
MQLLISEWKLYPEIPFCIYPEFLTILCLPCALRLPVVKIVRYNRPALRLF